MSLQGSLERFRAFLNCFSSLTLYSRVILDAKPVPTFAGVDVTKLKRRTEIIQLTEAGAISREEAIRLAETEGLGAISFEAEYEPVDLEDRRQDMWDRREAIMELAASGEISSDHAERLAADEGLGQFETAPDLGSFDVAKWPTWSIEMVVAWIIWRSAKAAAFYSDAYRERCLRWKRVGGVPMPMRPNSTETRRYKNAKWLLREMEPATLEQVCLDSKSEDAEIYTHLTNSPRPSTDAFDRAMELLRMNLVDGVLRAGALHVETNEFVEIPAVEWHYLQLETGLKQTRFVIASDASERPRFEALKLASYGVTQIFKAGHPLKTEIRVPPSRPLKLVGKRADLFISKLFNEAHAVGLAYVPDTTIFHVLKDRNIEFNRKQIIDLTGKLRTGENSKRKGRPRVATKSLKNNNIDIKSERERIIHKILDGMNLRI